MEPVRRLAASVVFLLATAAPSAGASGVFRHVPLPAPNSGPTSVLAPGIGILFTEFDANKIGFITSDGRLIEYSVPTPNSGPLDLTFSCVGGSNCNVWFTEFLANKIGKLNPHTGEFQEFSIPTPASGPHSIVAGFYPDQVWFTEIHANKIARMTAEGQFTEFEIPTAGSGPMGITRGSSDTIWFTEFQGNKIGRIPFAGGPITELAIPTPSSGPMDIGRDREGRMVFTEFLAGKVAVIGFDGRTITEIATPTPESGPSRICKPSLTTGDVWFTEMRSNRIGAIRFNHTITEYEIPTPGAEPYGCSFAGSSVWFAQKAANALGTVQHDRLVVMGAGSFDGWETSFRFSNTGSLPTHLYTGYFYEPQYICAGPCIWEGAPVVPANGTAELAGGPGPAVINTRPLDRDEFPTIDVRARRSASPGRATNLPATAFSAISRLDPSILVFAGAVRSPTARSNLLIANFASGDALDVRIDVLSRDGVLLGSESSTLNASFYDFAPPLRFLVDFPGRLGISDLTNGQIRVTKTGGGGLLWGTLTTIDRDSVVTDLGRSLSVADETVPGGDPLVVLGGAVGEWDTEFDVGNARAETLNGTIAILSCTIGATCPVPAISFSVPANGTATLRARDFPAFPEGLHTYLVRFEGTGMAPTLRARVVNRARPSQTAVLPTLHRSAIRKLGHLPFSFPGGARSTSGARSNLVLGEAGRDDATAVVQVFDPSGNLLKSVPVRVPQGRTLMLQDVVGGAGADLENAHVLVTRTGGDGTLWGMLATIDRSDALSVGWGVHP
jgi:virginiamycin B lyase